MISVLCANPDSVYKTLPGLDVWDKERNAYNFTGKNPVITHAPCQQWSRMRNFSKPDQAEKELAWFCLRKVLENGGVFEHPAGSLFFKEAKIFPGDPGLYSVDQFWWNLPARKRTYLYFSKCQPVSFPVRFDLIEYRLGHSKGGKKDLPKKLRSYTTPEFAKWLIDCVSQVEERDRKLAFTYGL